MTRALVLVVCLSATLQATAVVVFRTPQRIVLASDSSALRSMRSRDLRDGTTSAESSPFCKIKRAGHWWTLVAGFTRAHAPAFDVQAETIATLAPVRHWAAVKAAMTERLYPQMSRVLAGASASIARQFERGDLLGSYVIAGQDGSTLRAAVLSVVVDAVEPVRLTMSWDECPGALCADDGLLQFGATIAPGPLMTLITPPLTAWVARRDSAAARRIIQQQMAATPEGVRGPIDVLEIDGSGARWVERDAVSACGR